MAQILNIYNQFLNTYAGQQIDFLNDEFKIMLVTSGYTPNKDINKYKSDVTNEASGDGYTAGGITLTNVTYTLNGSIATLKADNPKWVGLNVNNIKYAVIYDNTPWNPSTESTDNAKCLIAYIDFGEVLSVINTELEIVWNNDGIIKFSIQ